MLHSLILILPVFLILFLGVIIDIANILPKQTGSILGGYVLYIALPILLIRVLAGSSVDEILHGGFWAGVIFAQLIIYVISYAGEFFISKRGHGNAASIAMACSCCNVAFIGLPVIMTLFPGNHEALVAAGIAVITPNAISIPCQIQMEYLTGKDGDDKIAKIVKAVLLNPLMVGTVVGFILCFSGVHIWQPLDKAAKMVGDTTAPCMLLALGLDLRKKVRVALSGNWKSGIPRFTIASVIKLVVNPIVAWYMLSLFGVSGIWLAVGVIQCGTATALVTYVISEIYGFASEEVAMIAVITNVLNLVTLTIIAGILQNAGVM
jgi:hypothetical protein